VRPPQPDRLVIVAPHLVAAEGHDQFLRPLPAAMRQMVEQAQVFRLQPMPPQPTPESAFLGLAPGDVRLARGPLTVAALRRDPPSDSVQFHLSLMSVDEAGLAASVPTPLPAEDVRLAMEAAQRLDTSRLTVLLGEQTDHALVWEKGSLDLGTTPPSEVAGQPIHQHLPEGDGETLLRRFIDDSVNLLDGLELNRRREGDGLPKLNLLWPWGFGFRTAVPNLALRRGEIVTVHSASLRLEGLCRLVGYQHTPRMGFSRGLFAAGAALRGIRPDKSLHLVLLPGFDEVQAHGRVDEGAWALDMVSRELLDHWSGTAEHPTEVLFLAPGGAVSPEASPSQASEQGLGFIYRSWSPASTGFPFDDRVFDDPRVPVRTVWEATRAIMEA